MISGNIVNLEKYVLMLNAINYKYWVDKKVLPFFLA